MVNRMSKYINTDALEVVEFTDREGSFSDGVQWLLEYIDKLPPADVQPIRRGAWERMAQKKNFLGCKMIRCSECFERYAVQNIDEERYCRACGARMNAGDNSITFHINDIEAEVAKIVQQAEAEKESGERDEC